MLTVFEQWEEKPGENPRTHWDSAPPPSKYTSVETSFK